MVNYSNKKVYQILFNIFLLLVMPISVLAPTGTWIPLIILALVKLCSVKSFKNVKFDKEYMALLVTFILITILSTAILNFDIKNLSRLLSLCFIIFSFFTIFILYAPEINYKSTSIQIAISFILSFLIIILDNFYQIGFKLWLSNNLDFKNFNNFYSFKNWVSFNEFHNNHQLIIENYLSNTYDRGITSLSVLAVPIFALCIFFNMKKTLLTIFLLSPLVFLAGGDSSSGLDMSPLLFIILSLFIGINAKRFLS